MTKSDWLVATEPIDMLAFLGERLTERKEQLFAAACLGEITRNSPTGTVGKEVEPLERYADGQANMEEVRTFGSSTAWLMSRPRGLTADWVQDWAKHSVGSERVADLIRDLFNPFYQGALDPAWLTSDDGVARKIAKRIYEERRFEDLPILADALEDGGCTDSDVLNHCRQPDRHVLGCWVIDLILSKDR
jgi:hypothetical protein